MRPATHAARAGRGAALPRPTRNPARLPPLRAFQQELKQLARAAKGPLMFSSLMTTRRFAPLFWCQFFSAFNDNFLKNALVFLILFTPSITDSGSLITLTAAIFIGPFFFLSGLGGEMADRFDKSIVA